jgi:hypothetical protein
VVKNDEAPAGDLVGVVDTEIAQDLPGQGDRIGASRWGAGASSMRNSGR